MPSTRDDCAPAYVEPVGLIECVGQFRHRQSCILRHDIRPDEASHAAEVSPHRVFPALLAKDTVGGRLVRAKQFLIFDLAVELTQMAMIIPVEVGNADQVAVINYVILQPRRRNAVAMELDSCYGFPRGLGTSIGQLDGELALVRSRRVHEAVLQVLNRFEQSWIVSQSRIGGDHTTFKAGPTGNLPHRPFRADGNYPVVHAEVVLDVLADDMVLGASCLTGSAVIKADEMDNGEILLVERKSVERSR